MSTKTGFKALFAGTVAAISLNLAVANDAEATKGHGNNGNDTTASVEQDIRNTNAIDMGQTQTQIQDTNVLVKPTTNVGIEQDISFNPTTNVGIEQDINFKPATNVGVETGPTNVTVINQNPQGGHGPIDVGSSSSSGVHGSGNSTVDISGPLGGQGGSVNGVEGGDVRTGDIGSNSTAATGAIDNNSSGGNVGNVSPSQETKFVNRNVTPPPSMGNVWMAQAASACNKQQYFNLSMAAAFMGGGGLGYGKTSVAGTEAPYTSEELLALKPEERLSVMDKYGLSSDEKATAMCLIDNYGKIKMQFEMQYKQAIGVAGIQAEASMYNNEVITNGNVAIEQMRQTGSALNTTLANACKNPNSKLCIDATQTLLGNIAAAGSRTPYPTKPQFVNIPVLQGPAPAQ